jgi:hypothetical protein
MEIVGSVVSGAGSSMLSCGRLVAVSEEFITTETFTSFWHWAISAGVSLMALDASLLTEAVADIAGAEDGVVDADDGAGLYEERLDARDEDW